MIVRVTRAALAGRMSEAAELAELAREEGQRGVAENAEIFHGSQLYCLARDIGGLEEAARARRATRGEVPGRTALAV